MGWAPSLRFITALGEVMCMAVTLPVDMLSIIMSTERSLLFSLALCNQGHLIYFVNSIL